MILEEKRKTRGRRMRELVGLEAEKDAAFWNHETWESDDSDFEMDDQGFCLSLCGVYEESYVLPVA